MGLMSVAKANQYCSTRSPQGTPHNAGIGSKSTLERIGHELKVNPPKVLAKTARKSGKARAEKQRIAILFNKARKTGAKV